MKNILVILFLTVLSSCVKVQKKNDSEPEPEKINTPVVEQTQEEIKPVVVVLNEVMSLTQDLEIIADEVRLKANARIYSNQFELKIKTQKLLAEEGALIQTFPSLSVAPRFVPGVNGGTVKIIVSHVVQGNLQVYMNGQQGGPGKMGWSYDGLECKPGGGMNSGRSGSFFMESEKSEYFFLSTHMDRAPAGEPGYVWTDYWAMNNKRHFDPANYKAHNETCDVVPPPAQPGTPGQICLKLKTGEIPHCERF